MAGQIAWGERRRWDGDDEQRAGSWHLYLAVVPGCRHENPEPEQRQPVHTVPYPRLMAIPLRHPSCCAPLRRPAPPVPRFVSAQWTAFAG